MSDVWLALCFGNVCTWLSSLTLALYTVEAATMGSSTLHRQESGWQVETEGIIDWAVCHCNVKSNKKVCSKDQCWWVPATSSCIMHCRSDPSAKRNNSDIPNFDCPHNSISKELISWGYVCNLLIPMSEQRCASQYPSEDIKVEPICLGRLAGSVLFLGHSHTRIIRVLTSHKYSSSLLSFETDRYHQKETHRPYAQLVSTRESALTFSNKRLP